MLLGAIIGSVLFISLIIWLAAGYLGALMNWHTRPLPENPQAFHISRYFDEIHEFAEKETVLESFTLTYVKSDGTFDFHAEYEPKAVFTFLKGHSEPGAAIGAPLDQVCHYLNKQSSFNRE